jgi:UDP-glucose 4-epimerase
VVVTGGFGFLGSWLVRRLASEGHRVSVLARRQRPLFSDAVEWIPCDVADWTSCRDALAGKTFDSAILCACVHLNHRPPNFPDVYRVNTLGTRFVTEALKPAGLASLIHLSTFHVYGTLSGVVDDTTPVRPVNDYGASHWYAEDIVRRFAAETGTRTVSLRLSNSYGCPIDPESSQWTLLFNDLCRMVAIEGQLVLRSNGLAWRDFVWLGHVCSVISALVEPSCNVAGVRRLANGESVSLLHVATEIAKAWLDYTGNRVTVNVNDSDKTEAGPPLKLDTSTLREDLGKKFPQMDHHFQQEAKSIFECLAMRQSGAHNTRSMTG